MELYSAKILVNGSLFDEVRRTDLTAPEVLILRHMHGADAIKEIKIVGKSERTVGQERVRLFGVPGENPSLYKPEYIKAVFPTEFSPLPEALPADMLNIDAMAADLKKAQTEGKPVEEMSLEEMDAEQARLDEMRKRMAKARAAKKANQPQQSVMD